VTPHAPTVRPWQAIVLHAVPTGQSSVVLQTTARAPHDAAKAVDAPAPLPFQQQTLSDVLSDLTQPMKIPALHAVFALS
jgi:hypothetical protein